MSSITKLTIAIDRLAEQVDELSKQVNGLSVSFTGLRTEMEGLRSSVKKGFQSVEESLDKNTILLLDVVEALNESRVRPVAIKSNVLQARL